VVGVSVTERLPDGIEPLLSAKQVCEWLACSENQLRTFVNRDGLPVIRTMRDLRFAPSDVRAWIEARRTVAASASRPRR
jgi:predicted DNA-binding transcriptional regulator AlpA